MPSAGFSSHIPLRSAPFAVRVPAAGAAAALAVYTAVVLFPGGSEGDVSAGFYAVLLSIYAVTALMCATRAAVDREHRTAWLLFAGGMLSEGIGWLTYELLVTRADVVASPSVSDFFWLGGYGLYSMALVALLRGRMERVRVGPWLDGAVAALASAAVIAGFVDGVIPATSGSLASVAVSVAYPLVDLILLVMLAAVFAVNSWRPAGLWIAIAGALTARIVVDTLYLKTVATGTWEPGTLLDAGWMLAAILLGLGAWWPRPAAEEEPDGDSILIQAVPAAFTLVALVLVVYDRFDPLDHAAAVLAYLALVAGAVRTATMYGRARGIASQRAALERTAAILRAAGESIYMIDSTGTITYANPATERTLGYAPGELVGLQIHATMHHSRPDGSPYPLVESPVRATVTDGQERRIVDDTFWRADGTPVPVEYTVTPIRDGDAIAGAAVVFSDVTDRRRAERDEHAQHVVSRELAEAKTLDEARVATLRAVVEAMSFAGAIGWIGDTGSGALRYGLTWAPQRRDELDSALAGTELAPGAAGPGAAMRSGQVEWTSEMASHLPPAACRVVTEIGASGSICMPIVYGTETIGVTEFLLREGHEPDPDMVATLAMIGAQIGQYSARRNAEVEAERLKNEFFALVSHELRTPLTSILGYLDIALEDEELHPSTRRALTVVERNSQRLLRLVGDLLFVAQVEGGETSIEAGTVDLRTIAAQAVEAAYPRAGDAGIELLLEAADLPPIEGDAGRVAQAIDNLISNAIKFTPDGGQVRVRLASRDGVAVIEVSDTGIGISAGDQARLFDRFYRSSTATERAIQGVGLGLTIVKAIVEGHGGSIEVESDEGRGTTFRALLPMRLVEARDGAGLG